MDQAQQTFTRLPPYSEDAEKSLLGAVLLEGDILTSVLTLVDAEDFYVTAHQKIYAACQKLFHEGNRIDAVLIKSELERRGDLEQVGGEAYLAQLAAQVPSAAGAEDYARIVSEKAVTRSLIHACTSIQSAAYEGGMLGHELLDWAESQVFSLSRGAADAETVGIQSVLNETFDEIQALIDSGGALAGLATGYVQFDEMTAGLNKGDLVVVAGRPSMGKTTFSNCIVDHVGVVESKPVVYFSLEVNRKHLVRNMLCARARVELQRVRRGDLDSEDIEKLTRAAGELMDAPIFIDDSTNTTALEMRAKARRIKKQHGLSLVVVDYLQLMDSGLPAKLRENRQNEVAMISRSLKAMARELEIPVIANSQLNRAVDSREDRLPRMSDLRECVTGDTLVLLADGRRVPIAELVEKTPEVWSVSDGRIVPARADLVWSVGRRRVHEVRLASGRRIRATRKHRFLTGTGWKRLADCAPGERLAVAHALPQTRDVPSVVRVGARGNAAALACVEDVATGELRWDRIDAIEPAGVEDVFDLTVPGTANWLADGIVSHNSGALEQDADLICFLYRESQYKPSPDNQHKAEVIIGKQRNGPTGRVQLHFFGHILRFENPAFGAEAGF